MPIILGGNMKILTYHCSLPHQNCLRSHQHHRKQTCDWCISCHWSKDMFQRGRPEWHTWKASTHHTWTKPTLVSGNQRRPNLPSAELERTVRPWCWVVPVSSVRNIAKFVHQNQHRAYSFAIHRGIVNPTNKIYLLGQIKFLKLIVQWSCSVWRRKLTLDHCHNGCKVLMPFATNVLCWKIYNSAVLGASNLKTRKCIIQSRAGYFNIYVWLILIIRLIEIILVRNTPALFVNAW